VSYALEHPDLRIVEEEPDKPQPGKDDLSTIGRKMLSALSRIAPISVPVQEMTQSEE
jgi:hypothetical protein